MTSINGGMRIGGFRQEVDQQKLGPALLIAVGEGSVVISEVHRYLAEHRKIPVPDLLPPLLPQTTAGETKSQ
jgi:hypothetical protein